MKKIQPLARLVLFLGILFAFAHARLLAQTLPLEIRNTSEYPDDQIYVAIIGEDLTGPPGMRIWVDCRTSAVNPMNTSYNTVPGPIYNGNMGPGGNARYANCFTKLSDIPGKMVQMPQIQGSRIFISVGEPLYLYFFGPYAGYAAPSHTDPNDPSKGIKYEIIEQTYNQYGYWGNTTRVDGYQYPMGFEVNGAGGTFARTGELKTHCEIISDFLASVPAEFQSCYDAEHRAIIFPTKTPAFTDGSVGTMPTPGPYRDYMKPYIDAIWSKYANEDLRFRTSDGSEWRGRVQPDDRFIIQAVSGGFTGRQGIIQRRPTTQEAFEGKGVLDRIIADPPVDLMVQAQICAAITRHVINTTTPNVGLQNFGNRATYFQTAPTNYYTAFWHRPDISVNGLSYGFAYDDVFDQSATLHSPSPTKLTILFGGYGNNTIPQAPFGGGALAIPGTIEAENFDAGGEGVSYHDATIINQGNSNYRACEAVDIDDLSGSVRAVGYIVTDEWMEYTVNVATAQTVQLEARVASASAGKSFRVEMNGTTIATVNVPNTGGWTTFQSVLINNINLTAGQKVMRIYATTGEFNLDKVIFNPVLNVPPTVSLTAPANNATYTAPASVNLTATATDPDGTISKVEFFNGPTKLGEDATAPYTYNWVGVTAGTYTLTAVATDNGGLTRTSTVITIVVNNPANQAPAVSLTAPANNATYLTPATVNLTATASDPDGTVSKVEFFNGVTKIGEDATAPYSYNWMGVTAGTYALTAIATDNGGLTTTSAVITIVVNNPNQSPIVSLTAPTNNVTYITPATVALTATASDVDGTVAKVEFFNGATKLGEDATAPYTYNWVGVTAGTYTLTAIATDNEGLTTTSTVITIVVSNPNQAPIVSLTAPANNTTYIVPATVNLTATASDPDGTVSKVEFFNGATKLSEDATAPYTFDWVGVTAGTYALTALVTDNQGFSTTSSTITILVRNPNQAPIVNITKPGNNANYPENVNIELNAYAFDTDGSITKVEFYNGTEKLFETSTSPYTFTWNNVPRGTYSITAVATDNEGTIRTSTIRTIVVRNQNVAPNVSITAPLNDASFAFDADVTINAIASDANGSIARVEFYYGTTKLGEDFTSPYSLTWDNFRAGSYTLIAKAIDNEGAVSTSEIIRIFVAEEEPKVTTSLFSGLQGQSMVYPNPTEGLVYINTSLWTNANLTISDMQGGLIRNYESLSEELDLSFLESGVYYLQFHSETESYIERLVVH